MANVVPGSDTRQPLSRNSTIAILNPCMAQLSHRRPQT